MRYQYILPVLVFVFACDSDNGEVSNIFAENHTNTETNSNLQGHSKETEIQNPAVYLSDVEEPPKEMDPEKAREAIESLEVQKRHEDDALDDYENSTDFEKEIDALNKAILDADGEPSSGWIFNGAYSTAHPEIASLSMEFNGGASLEVCSAIVLNSRFLLTAAHCVQRYVNMSTSTRTGTVSDSEIRITYGVPAPQQDVLVYAGSLSVKVHANYNDTQTNRDPDDDIAIVMTSYPLTMVYRARVQLSTDAAQYSHDVVGWSAEFPNDPRVKRGLQPYGNWLDWEGLKLNIGSNNVNVQGGDSGGGAGTSRSSLSASFVVYDGVLAKVITGGFWPGSMSARIPYKIGWIENASDALGTRVDFSCATSVVTQIHPVQVRYCRAEL